LAYHDDEAAVLREFIVAAVANGYDCRPLNPLQVSARSPAVNLEGLRGALWSPLEVCVDPREVIANLPAWLAKEYKVEFVHECAVTAYERPGVFAGGRNWVANNLYVCAGDDLQSLFPEVFAASGLERCKLQMMRSRPVGNDQRIGPMLAAGLTLAHYKSFQNCPSLTPLKERFAAELPDYVRYGIHVMVSKNGVGELTLGDSHEYGSEITPFDKQEVDELVLRYLNTFLRTPNLQIASRWNGIYVKHPVKPYFITRPETGITVVTGVGGAGMTLSFGLAEKIVKENLGEN
jgi:FAD dependent oxidoreductase TIGR03364